jgi:DsbC/DsbD-like thiol-disulfide interchange protein
MAELPVVLAALVVSSFSASAQSGPPPRQVSAPHVRVELIADSVTPVKGRPLWVGMRFVLEPGWHIYWQNPGDSGGPPTVTWHLPEGVTAGDVQWPAPERIEAGPIVNYGYQGEVVLPVALRLAPGAAPDFIVGASIKWLVCRDMCLPGKADLELTLPVAADLRARARGWAALVRDSLDRVPRKAPVSWKATARSEGDRLVIAVDTGRPEKGGVFFPLDADQIDDSASQEVTALPRGIRFSLRKSNRLLKPPSTLKGVVSLQSAPAFVITAPVVDVPAPERNGRNEEEQQ